MSPSRFSSRLLALLLGGALLSSPVASAQQPLLNAALSLEPMRLATNRSGLISIESGAVPQHLAWDVSVWMGMSSNPLGVRLADGARGGALASNQVGGSVVAALGLFGWAQLGFELPVVAFQQRRLDKEVLADGLPSLAVGGMGGFRLVPKVRLLTSARHGVDLAMQAGFNVPMGRDAGFIGDTGTSLRPELAVSRSFGALGVASNLGMAVRPELAVSRSFGALRVAGNLGMAVRPTRPLLNLTHQRELSGQLGAGYRLGTPGGSGLPLELALALAGNTGVPRPLARGSEDSFELRGMLTYDLSTSVQLFAGAGSGFSSGRDTPNWRAFGGVRLSTSKN